MTTVNGAHCDNVNQQFSILGVQGTLGTSDTGGTAETLPIGVNKDNGGLYVSPITLPPTQDTNGSYVLTRNASGYIGTIVETIGTVNYTKTLTRDGSNYIGTISSWS